MRMVIVVIVVRKVIRVKPNLMLCHLLPCHLSLVTYVLSLVS
jgi:hypothetical protein